VNGYRSSIEENKLYYDIHFEVDYHRYSKTFFLRDIRLVLKFDSQYKSDYDSNIKLLLAEYIDNMLDLKSREDQQAFFKSVFGFDYPG
jgi:hypothetical protein